MSNKIAIVTGGSRGLERNTAEHLATKNIDVILTYRSRKDEADAVVAAVKEQGVHAVALQLDVGKCAGFATFVQQVRTVLREHWQHDSFDFLVNNARIGIYASIMETTEEQFDELVNIHFKGVFFLTQKLFPLMANGGRIVNLSSGLARFSYPGYAAYASLKGAIDTLTRYMAVELGPRRIAVNSVAPGAIETDFSGGTVRDNAELNATIASRTALGRVGIPDDIGGAIAALLTEDSHWINGQRIEVSGGIHL